MKAFPLSLFAFLFGSLAVFAQIGDKADKAGEVQVPIVPKELIPPSPALTPEEELKTFQLAPGFRAELVASDPLIGDPVFAQFAPDGRLWVVEMRSYMPDLDGHGEDQPTGRVVILSDTDGDGRMDKSEVFIDQLVMPRALAIVGDGALVGAPPMLWYCRDTDGDGRADQKIEVARDFGIQVDPARPELANPERAPNALLPALDNWVYAGAYAARFRLNDGTWTRATSTFRGQWGLSQDDWGHLFHNSNSDQLRADLVPSHYLARNTHFLRATGTNVKVAGDQFVWPIRVNPGINRGYRPEMLRDNKLKEFTAACAPWVYRGDLFPAEFYGNAFVCEPAGNLVKRNLITAANGSLAAKEAYEQREFLASADERFRPVNLTTGPDGALYLVDFYRGVIQHRISLTTYLRQQIVTRGLDKPIALGRIWRIVPEGAKRTAPQPLAKAAPADLVAALSSPNSWQRETAQQLLVFQNKPETIPLLGETALLSPSPLGKVHALWTLDGLRQTSLKIAGPALGDSDPRVRVAAVRVTESLLTGDTRAKALKKLISLSQTEAAPEVQLQLALSLGEARTPEADDAMAALAARAKGNMFLRDAVLTGLFGRELELLTRLLADPAWQARQTEADLFLTGLARCVFAERDPARVGQLLDTLAALPAANASRRNNLLVSVGTAPGVTLKHPIKFPAEPPAFAALGAIEITKAPLAKASPFFRWPGKPGAPDETLITPLTPEQQTRFEVGKQIYAAVCAACHQPHGLGMDGLAPPLAESEWVLGPVERVGRIVLHGVRGPIKVKGLTYSLDMPSMGAFDDDTIASILTYLRREWGHDAAPVEPATIKALRAATSTRSDAWTQEELLKFP
jgi:mono/diheme cytochrome c family protein/glucose/arabinose dehydrogenase